MKRILRKWKILFFVWIIKISEVYSLSGWTEWQNKDRPDHGDGDKEEGYYSCGVHDEPTATECRVVGSDIIFTSDTEFLAPDVLYWPCTRKGVSCRNRDQASWGICHDYEIRFYCPASKTEDDFSQFWLIALVAASCVTVPLLFIVALQCYRDFRLKRFPFNTQRERNNNTHHVRQTRESTIGAEINQPPPSYETLFGTTELHGVTENISNEHVVQNVQNSEITSPELGTSNDGSVHPNGTENISQRTVCMDDVSISQISAGPIYCSDLYGHSQLQCGNSEVCRNNTVTTHNTRPSRHFPGMHISVFERAQTQSTENVTPPPSYKDVIFKCGNSSRKYSLTSNFSLNSNKCNSLTKEGSASSS